MELETLITGLGDYSKLAEDIKQTRTSDYNKYKKQYDPKEHDVIKDTIKRADKTITVTTVDSETGAATNTQKTVFVSRLSIPLQKQIVARAAAFLCGNPVEIIAQYDEGTVEENLMTVLLKTWDDNKLDYESKRLAKLMMAETECAELWYSEKASEEYWKGTPNEKPKVVSRLRVRILANSLGDSLYPVFNQYGDMIAFGRGYDVTNGATKEEHFDIYTETNFYLGVKKENVWEVKTEVNPHKKIPVIYYSQDKT
jgi:hypothetical protein